jgi:hypothetical protein
MMHARYAKTTATVVSSTEEKDSEIVENREKNDRLEDVTHFRLTRGVSPA